MKIHRQIVHNWDINQVAVLRQHNIKVNVGMDRFNIYDINLYEELSPLFDKWSVNIDTIGEDFSPKEVLSAEYCIIKSWNLFGYPMPDNDRGYLYNTYETKEMCDKCGIGKIQKDDFRAKKVPKYPIWGLGWIFDEFFVRIDLYEKIFKPLGIAYRPLRRYRNNAAFDSYVQLIIPVIDEPLDLSSYEYEICPKCGVIKYDPETHGYYPLHEQPIAHIYKSKEFFGSGFSANRKIFVSAKLRDMMIESGMLKSRNFVPCAKKEELSIKNQGLIAWEKTERNIRKSDTNNIIVAIPD